MDEAYRQFESDHAILERTLDLSSKELLQANSEMRAVFEVFPDLFMRLDQDGTVLAYKAGAGTSLPVAPESLLHRRLRDLPLTDVAAQFDEALSQIATRGTLVTIEYGLPTNGGRAFFEARSCRSTTGRSSRSCETSPT